MGKHWVELLGGLEVVAGAALSYWVSPPPWLLGPIFGIGAFTILLGIENILRARGPRRNAWLRDGIIYAIRGQWPENESMPALSGSGESEAAANIIGQMRQRAFDGDIQWGQRRPLGTTIFEAIPHNFRQNHKISFLGIALTTNHEEVQTGVSSGRNSNGQFYALQVNRWQVERWWPRRRRRLTLKWERL